MRKRAAPPRSPAQSVPPVPHARELLRVAGLPAVRALFARDATRVERLFFLPELAASAAPFAAALARARRPYRAVAAAELARIAGSAMHGGIVAVARPPALDLRDAGAVVAWARGAPMLLVLDGVANPQNLGAIARSAAFFGVTRLLLSADPAQALPSDAAYRIAEGGLDRIDLCRVADLPAALAALGRGFRVVGTALTPSAVPLATVPRDRPVALVLGNEERGLGPATMAACQIVARIPGSGLVQSLNVAATAAIVLHWFAAAP